MKQYWYRWYYGVGYEIFKLNKVYSRGDFIGVVNNRVYAKIIVNLLNKRADKLRNKV